MKNSDLDGLRLYQQHWYIAARNNKELFIPAERGTGKTHFICCLAKILADEEQKVLIVCPNSTMVHIIKKKLSDDRIVVESITTCIKPEHDFSFDYILFDDATIDSKMQDKASELLKSQRADCRIFAIGTEKVYSNCDVFDRNRERRLWRSKGEINEYWKR